MQIAAEDLVIERGARRVIDGLSFLLSSGEALVLAGANGAGKTTLLRALAGYLQPAHGAIRLQGGPEDKTLAELAHVVGHANAIKANLTVRENITFWSAYLGGRADEARIAAALRHFALDDLEGLPAAYLSAGQKRRVGLARLIAADRPVWLLDEPTAALDTASSSLLSAAVNAHTKDGGMVIAATHLPLGFERARELRLSGGKAAA